MKERLYKIDNLKGILIFLVVFGHIMERLGQRNEIYNLIYVFHMPLFVIITGMTFKNYILNNKVKIIFTKILIPYVIFQIFYILLINNFRLSSIIGWKYLLIPYYHMWYLFSLVIWSCGTIILKNYINKYTILFFFLSGIVINFLDINLHILAISRTVIFYPYFLIGYLLGIKQRDEKVYITYLLFIIYIYIYIIFIHNKIPNEILWGTYPYSKIPVDILLSIKYKIIFYISSLLFCYFLYNVMPNKKNIFSIFGTSTMQVYLWHLFFILIIKKLLDYKGYSLNMIGYFILTIFIISLIYYLEKLIRRKTSNFVKKI